MRRAPCRNSANCGGRRWLGTCIETGWSAASGATLAQATTGYTEGQATVAGVSFARFLISLGVQGSFNLGPAHTSRVKPSKRRHRTH